MTSARDFLERCPSDDGFIPSVKVVVRSKAGDTVTEASTVFWDLAKLDAYLAEHPEPPRKEHRPRSLRHHISIILSQDQIWVDKAGTVHTLTEMSVRYKATVLAFLEARAGRLEFNDALSDALALAEMSDGAQDMFGSDANFSAAWSKREVVEWLNARPLVKELRRQVEAGIGGTDGEPPKTIKGAHPNIVTYDEVSGADGDDDRACAH